MRHGADGDPVAVALVLPGAESARWLQRLIDRLAVAEFIALTTIVKKNTKQQSLPGAWLARAWMRIESFLIRHLTSADEVANQGRAALTDGVVQEEAWPVFADNDSLESAIVASRPAIIVWLPDERPPAGLFGSPSWSILTVPGAGSSAFGLAEYMQEGVAKLCQVLSLGERPGDDRIVASTFAATDSVLLVREINAIRAKYSALLDATINRIRHQARPAGEDDMGPTGSQSSPATPGILNVVTNLGRVIGRCCAEASKRAIYYDQWRIGYRTGGGRLDQQGMKSLIPPHRGFWADPFIAERGGRRFIFFEELCPRRGHGHIAAVEIAPDGRHGKPTEVLVRDYHLSYPYLFEYGGELFMAPESADAGRVEVFRCRRFPDRWEPHAILLDGVRAFDPTLFRHDSRWWLFVSMQHHGSSPNDELHLFHADEPFGDWQPHALNPVQLDVRAARPAGAVFTDNGKLYRPAQDCSRRYGWAISIREIRCITPDAYEEVEAERILPDWASGAHATHTVNQAGGITVCDYKIDRPRFSRQ